MIFKGLDFAIDNFLSSKELRLNAFLTCFPIFKDVSSHSFKFAPISLLDTSPMSLATVLPKKNQ